MSEPLIVTAQLDGAAQAFYEELRQRYFPPERNLIPAHLTLFHKLPDEEPTYAAVREAAGAGAVSELRDARVRSIGRGVAVFFRGPELAAVHGWLLEALSPWLSVQDRQPLRPHIVVQNKVDGETARRTLAELEGLVLVEPRVEGLTLWRYLGGPWEHVRDFGFGKPVDSTG